MTIPAKTAYGTDGGRTSVDSIEREIATIGRQLSVLEGRVEEICRSISARSPGQFKDWVALASGRNDSTGDCGS